VSPEELLLQPLEVHQDSPVGGKARALASLAQARLPIPDWFVILPSAFDMSLGEEGRAALTRADGAEAVADILGSLVPASEVTAAAKAAYTVLCPDGASVAVRSSAADEDSAEHSFAGQLESYLFVTSEQLERRIVDVWRSGFTDRIIAYRKEAGLEPLPTAPAVIVQRIIDGTASGVAFSSDPVSGRRGVAVVAGVWGLGEALVSGEADSDTWHLDREGRILEQNIVHKHIAARRNPDDPEGISRVPLAADLADRASLTDMQVAAVGQLARDAERHFGLPQDIEWTWSEDKLYLLQSRPITTLTAKPDPDDPPRIWDNTNIIESYSGITTPFTFSFIRRCYEQVYRGFCRIMRVPDQVIEDHAEIFACLLGLLNGRVYYNMLNGYRILTLLPGYKLNRRFTEEMLGFRETLPDEIEAEMEAMAVGARGHDLLLLLRTLWGMTVSFFRIESRVDAFYDRLHRVLPAEPRDLSDASPDDLAKLYRYLETELLHRWDAPTINDFFAAIFHGSLRRLTERWLTDESGSLHNDLLCGDRELVSMEIAELVQNMATLLADQPILIEKMETDSRVAVEVEIEQLPELADLYRTYLLRFGDRCLDELKLESSTVRDDPTPLYRAVAGYARHIRETGASEANVEQQILEAAEARVHSALAHRPIRRHVFGWVLKQTRQRVRCRENLRFERTRAFGMARRIGVEMGRRFNALGLIDKPRDIFYLTIDEMLAVVDGAAVTTDLAALVTLRRREFDLYHSLAPSAERFQTRGIPYIGDQFAAPAPTRLIGGGETLAGIGCCPGVIRGPVTIVEDPRGAIIPPGAIVVARRTDPGWVMVFPAAAGLLVERGSMLSHSAIVAREMGLPTIVSIPGLTGALSEGDLVEMDGAAGKVTRLEVDP